MTLRSRSGGAGEPLPPSRLLLAEFDRQNGEAVLGVAASQLLVIIQVPFVIGWRYALGSVCRDLEDRH